MDNDPVNQATTGGRTEDGRWGKGMSGNPNGRPRKPEINDLREALSYVAEQRDKTFLQHFVERAYENDQVAIALAKKVLPDKIGTEYPMTFAELAQRCLEAERRGENADDTVESDPSQVS